jgi:hypothetical protein
MAAHFDVLIAIFLYCFGFQLNLFYKTLKEGSSVKLKNYSNRIFSLKKSWSIVATLDLFYFSLECPLKLRSSLYWAYLSNAKLAKAKIFSEFRYSTRMLYTAYQSNCARVAEIKSFLISVAPMMYIPNQLIGAPLHTQVTIECITEASPKVRWSMVEYMYFIRRFLTYLEEETMTLYVVNMFHWIEYL